jgi:hypothetical protein
MKAKAAAKAAAQTAAGGDSEADPNERARRFEAEDNAIFRKFASYDITYLNARSIVWFYQHALMKEGGVHFHKIKDTILLVDEVDDIIVGDEGTSTWVTTDTAQSVHMTHALDQVLGFQTYGAPAPDRFVQKAEELKARVAKTLAAGSACRNGFKLRRIDGKYEYVSKNGDPFSSKYGDEKEFLDFKESRGRGHFRYCALAIRHTAYSKHLVFSTHRISYSMHSPLTTHRALQGTADLLLLCTHRGLSNI